jgi:hypothetical protein
MTQLADAIKVFFFGLLVGIFCYWLTQGSPSAEIIKEAIGVVLKTAGEKLAQPEPSKPTPAKPARSDWADTEEPALQAPEE